MAFLEEQMLISVNDVTARWTPRGTACAGESRRSTLTLVKCANRRMLLRVSDISQPGIDIDLGRVQKYNIRVFQSLFLNSRKRKDLYLVLGLPFVLRPPVNDRN